MPRLPTAWVPRPRLTDRLDRAAPLTVVRGPVGFGKTTLVADWVADRDDDGAAVAWVAAADVGPGGFWEGVARELGLPARGPGARQAVRERIGAGPGPVVVVVDGDDAVADEAVARTLVDLVQQVRSLRLVVCSRGVSPVEELGQLFVETEVVSGQDLRFTVDETEALLAVLGDADPAAHARRLDHALDGWPAATRAAAGRLATDPTAAGRLATDPAAALRLDDYLRRDAAGPDAGHRDLLLAVSVADDLTPAVATVLSGDPAAGDRLVELEREGLLTRRSAADGAFGFPPALRDALRAELEADDPDRLAALDERLARHYHETGRPERALVHAMRCRNWELAVAVTGERWFELIAYHGEVIRSALQAIPEEALAGQPTVQAGRALLAFPRTAPPRAPSLDVRLPDDPAALARLGASDQVEAVVLVSTAQTLMQRGAGRFSEAQQLTAKVEQVVAGSSGAAPVAGYLPILQLQWGITHLLAGALEPALADFHASYHGNVRNGVSLLAGNAAASMALLAAFGGDADRASGWLDREAAFPEPTVDYADRVRTWGAVARTLAAVDRLDRPQMAAAAADLGDPHRIDELWGFVAFALARCALVDGGRADMLASLDEIEATHRPRWQEGGITDRLLATVRAELLLALGHANRARAVLRCPGPGGGGDFAPRAVVEARLLLLSGRPDEAAVVARRELWRPAVAARTRAELLLVQAAVHLAAGRPAEAAAALADAVAVGRHRGLLLPFATVPRALLEALAPDVAGVADLLARLDAAGVAAVYPERVDLVALTRREQVVLEQLATRRTIEQIADHLVVSVNTVRTQLRAVYQKLDVHSRGDALSRAYEWGLLDRPG